MAVDPRHGRRIGLGLALVVSSLMALIVPAADAAEPELPVAPFSAGSIITDPLFYDFGTMTAADIQQFLDDQVPECAPDSEAPCLKDYRVDVSKITAIAGKCDNTITAARAQTAAQVIWTVATACEVNPQVLLVTLQKEQGLVTATSVAELKYRKAMGYGCPDTAECDDKYYGFFLQVYWAARSFNSYFTSPAAFRYQPGETSRIAYSPKTGCGSTRVALLNRATAALYNYTPYTPDEASLANPYEEGDECSSYGNRNFWLYFNSWFGDSSLGQYLVTSRGNTYLVAGDERWRMPAGAPQLGSALRELGLRGEVSTAYLSSLKDRGPLTPVVQIAGGGNRYYLLADGKKYVIDGCSRVRSFGFSCTVPVFRQSALKAYKRSAELQGSTTLTMSATDGSRFLLGPGGTRREIVGEFAATTEIALDTSVIDRIPSANPVIRPGSLTTNPVTGDGYYLPESGETTIRVDRSFLLSSGAPVWFGGADGGIDGALGLASIAVLPPTTDLPPFFRAEGVAYLLGATGKIPLASSAAWSSAFVDLDPAIAALIPVDPAFTSGSLAAPATVASTTGDTEYVVADGVRTPVDTATDAGTGAVVRVPAVTLRAIPLAP